ncbi:MAG: thioredoxin-disulfide reductase [Clostridium sp.]|nr:thioredoxin-disulfide reductase [Acetatifactor muris]MCM1526987.1 thioredoxin-disulfide reductase [Bacteroides sp.]MCM1563150.1 thioredoxin-disulfide reductase [Clostridium sp.]
MYDVIIIGSGPAGLSAAIYGIRAGLNLLVLEQNPMSGGQVLNTYEVDNYPGLPGINGFDMGQAFRAHADKLGVKFEEARVKEIIDNGDFKTLRARRQDYETRAVIVATGAEHARLGVPGEEELSGMGVSYCATCDGAFFKNKTVAVVGGGDVALEDAIYLARACGKVFLIHRRDELRGAAVLQDELKKLPNVEILYSHTVQEIRGEDSVQSLLVRDLKAEAEREISVDGVFIAVGILPNSALVRELVECDGAGYVLAGENCACSREGIYAAGDIRRKPLRQIVTAVADGANAVAAVEEFLRKIK